MKRILCSFFATLIGFSLSAQDLSIGKEDLRVIQSPDGGYHLYIRKKSDIQSVLLTETTRDPSLKADNYAYRNPAYTPVNGDEKRLLDGAFIPPEKKIYSLIDSTPEADPVFGEAYHIWIPYLISYGYAWSRHAEIQVLDGTYINVRAFARPFGDYSGAFADNPFRLRVSQKPLVAKAAPEDVKYMDDTVATFSDMAERTRGETLYARTSEDIVPLIRTILEPPGDKSLDVLFVIDATESMSDDIKKLRELLESALQELLPKYPSFRIGLVLYKDYFEDFLVKKASPFTSDITVFRKALGSFMVQGGRDIPEAVYEAMDTALTYPWNPGADRKIILIGDAPPHPKPRGRITKEKVDQAALSLNVQLNVIILPHGSTF